MTNFLNDKIQATISTFRNMSINLKSVEFLFYQCPFSSPEAALLLVSTKNRVLWLSPTPEVCDSLTSRHYTHAQSQIWQIWFVVSIYCVYKPFKTGMSLDLARGRDSWCWPKGAWPLGARMTSATLNHISFVFYHDIKDNERNFCQDLLTI